MMISARDIITRLPEADEARVRLELSGNLCRCTGYVGIVTSIMEVKQAYKKKAQSTRNKLGPLGSHPPRAETRSTEKTIRRKLVKDPTPIVPQKTVNLSDEDWQAVEAQGVELKQSFTVQHDRDTVWRFFDDLDQVARCMPGAKLTSPPKDGQAEGAINVKLGPIVSAFAGLVDVNRDDKNYSAVVRGAGRDANSASRARGLITYQIDEAENGASQVNISVKFLLAGALAQFSRSGLIKDVADHLTNTFARNLEARLSGAPELADDDTPLDANALARAAIWGRIKGFFLSLFGK
jgi:carbon-monoxide dehydrogenase small subunit